MESSSHEDLEQNPFVVGEKVSSRNKDGKCDRPWSEPHTVTTLISSVSLVIDHDGIIRHVSHLRKVPLKKVSKELSHKSCVEIVDTQTPTVDSRIETSRSIEDLPIIRNSSRLRAAPVKFKDYNMT